jgi:hypothetical protein
MGKMENKKYCAFNGFLDKNTILNSMSPIRLKTKIECGYCQGELSECVYAKKCQYKSTKSNIERIIEAEINE